LHGKQQIPGDDFWPSGNDVTCLCNNAWPARSREQSRPLACNFLTSTQRKERKMSEKPNAPKTKIEDLPEKKDGLSAEELENVAGGMLRSPAAGVVGKVGARGLSDTTQATLDSNGMPDTTSSSSDS